MMHIAGCDAALPVFTRAECQLRGSIADIRAATELVRSGHADIEVVDQGYPLYFT